MTRYDEDRDPHCLSPEAGAALLTDAPWQRLVVIGDSIAAGVREPRAGYRDLSTADRVRDALQASRELAYANFGTREQRVAEIAESQLPAALDLQPDLVLLVAGGNDALRRSFTPARVRDQLLDLVRPIRSSGSAVALFGLFDLPRSGLVPDPYAAPMAERFDALDSVMAEVAAEAGCIFIDQHTHPLARDPEIYASDRIHCNTWGHAVAAANTIRALHTYVAEVASVSTVSRS